MKQTNIDAMGIIVDNLAFGETFSRALTSVYSKRKVQIPFEDKPLDIDIRELKMPMAVTNALLRGRVYTLQEALDRMTAKTLLNIPGLGVSKAQKTFECVLDYFWEHMTERQQTEFLIRTVEMNECNLKEEF